MGCDGATFEEELDGARLRGQLGRVFTVMRDGQWRTLAEIQQRTGASDSLPAISARLRDFRKERCGGYAVLRRRRGVPARGLFEYRLLVPAQQLSLLAEADGWRRHD